MLREKLLVQVKEYVSDLNFKKVFGLKKNEQVKVSYLAQGEYNLNYFLEGEEGKKYVFRINTGSQMNLKNQIAYEFKALKLIEKSEVTPKPFYLDDTLEKIPYGILVMEYLEGEPLDYRYDLIKAANTFAKIHGLQFEDKEVDFLVKEPGPFTGIYNEASRLLDIYFSCQEAKLEVAKLLEKLIIKAEERKKEEEYFLREPWLRVVNTEVNSHNFIINKSEEICYLIDWEKPILGEPAQDLSHFLIATTTKWKRNYVLSQEEEKMFIENYLKFLPECPQKYTLIDRINSFKFFNYLRAVSWCAMAWTEYIKPGRPLTNQDTFNRIKEYLEPNFIKYCFPDELNMI